MSLVVLLVDQDRSPPRAILDSFGAASVWWDRDGTWRQVWGHRVYGERIRFDAAGRYRGTSPPLTGL